MQQSNSKKKSAVPVVEISKPKISLPRSVRVGNVVRFYQSEGKLIRLVKAAA